MLCTGILLAACGGENTDPVDPVIPEPEPETRTLTFVLPAEGFKTAWEAGDQIVVHGEYAAKQVTVTLAAGDISADGTTATKEVSGLYPYVNEECGSTLYASWPAASSENLKHCFYYTGFNNSNSILLAACEVEDTFTFHNICSAVTFQVTGDFDSYILTGRKDAPVGYEYYQVMITDKVVNLSQYRQGPLVNISGDLSGSGLQTAYIPGAIDLPKGYVLKFVKDGKAIKAVTDKHAFSVPQCGILELGDVTDRLEDFAVEINTAAAVDISLEGTANCYLINGAGVYKFPSVKGNSTTPVGSIETVKVLWETWNNTETVTRKSVIKAVLYENSQIYFEVPSGYHPGNALIAALDEDDNILWSWHIWLPETPVTDVDGTDLAGAKAMSRNLGALKDAPAGAEPPMESYGLYYQFGRKDPFPGPATYDGTITQQEGQVSVEESVAQPTVLYYLAKKDWQNGGESVAMALWEKKGAKTLYDPCPPGYGLPIRDKTYLMWSGNNLYSTMNLTLGLMTVGGKVFPLAGYISDTDGTYQNAGTHILLWSEHYDSGTENGYGVFGPFIYKEADWCKSQGNIRSKAGSARCIVKK